MQAAVIGRRLICGRPTVAVSRPVFKAKARGPWERSNNMKDMRVQLALAQSQYASLKFSEQGYAADDDILLSSMLKAEMTLSNRKLLIDEQPKSHLAWLFVSSRISNYSVNQVQRHPRLEASELLPVGLSYRINVSLEDRSPQSSGGVMFLLPVRTFYSIDLPLRITSTLA